MEFKGFAYFKLQLKLKRGGSVLIKLCAVHENVCIRAYFLYWTTEELQQRTWSCPLIQLSCLLLC
jgi:hypothetical protein